MVESEGGEGLPSATTALISSTTSMGWASGLVRGFLSYRQSTSVMRKSRSAWTIAAVIADSVSLSPNLISDTASVSFSLTMGITPMSSSSVRVFRALRYRDCYVWVSKGFGGSSSSRLTSAISLLVRRICAIGCRRWVNKLSQRLINRHWPMAANAYRVVSKYGFKTSPYQTNLKSGHVFWSLFHIHPPETNTNGSRRHNDYSVPIFSQLHRSLDYETEDRKKRLMALFIHNGACS